MYVLCKTCDAQATVLASTLIVESPKVEAKEVTEDRRW